jgi:hypothetical protein
MFKRKFVTDTETLVKLLDNARDAERTHKKARQEWDEAVHQADVTFYYGGINKHEVCFFKKEEREAFLEELREEHGEFNSHCTCRLTRREVSTFDSGLSEGEIEAILERDHCADQNAISDIATRCHDKRVDVHYLLIDADNTMDWIGWRQHGFMTAEERDTFYERIILMAGGSSSLLWQKVLSKLNVTRGMTDLHTFKNEPYSTVVGTSQTKEELQQTCEYLIRMMKKDLGIPTLASPRYSPNSPKYHD